MQKRVFRLILGITTVLVSVVISGCASLIRIEGAGNASISIGTPGAAVYARTSVMGPSYAYIKFRVTDSAINGPNPYAGPDPGTSPLVSLAYPPPRSKFYPTRSYTGTDGITIFALRTIGTEQNVTVNVEFRNILGTHKTYTKTRSLVRGQTLVDVDINTKDIW